MISYKESKLQIAVVDYLRGQIRRGRNVMHTQAPFASLLWLHPVNEFKDEKEAFWGTQKGIKPGAADLLFWWEGGVGAIELKIDGTDMTERQRKFRDTFISLGGKHAVCRSVIEVRDTLISWGLECKNMVAMEPTPTEREKRAFVHEMYRPK